MQTAALRITVEYFNEMQIPNVCVSNNMLCDVNSAVR